ncbi:MAG: hypothetical protein KGP27_05590 [Hyphomicrobiales bacterium]|nr:hypothetical protein [Hyphomicrobiales bacterium]
MSTSDQTDFDRWLADMHGSVGDFTALVVLVDIADTRVTPLCSTYLHVIGTEVDWNEVSIMFAGSGQTWNGAAFFPTQGRNGGPIDNPTARVRLKELEAEVSRNRMILNDGHFFDDFGRRIKIDPV